MEYRVKLDYIYVYELTVLYMLLHDLVICALRFCYVVVSLLCSLLESLALEEVCSLFDCQLSFWRVLYAQIPEALVVVKPEKIVHVVIHVRELELGYLVVACFYIVQKAAL